MTANRNPHDNKPLARKALGLSALFFAGVGLLVLLPAGTARYWQAWLYLTLFAGLWAGLAWRLFRRDPALLERRLGLGPFAETDPVQKGIQLGNSVLSMALFAVSGLDYGLHGARVPPAVALLADCILPLAAWALWAVLRANRYAAGAVRVEQGQSVSQSGPYALVRHPMYAVGMLFFCVTPLGLASLWGLVPALLLCGGVVVRLLHEERLLRAQLPGYAAYCAKVRWRLVPGLW